MVANGSEVGLAFLLVTGAGLSTLIGAAMVIVIRKPRPVYLAAALGLSAGVMMYDWIRDSTNGAHTHTHQKHTSKTHSYVSLVDVFWLGSIQSFKQSGLSDTASFNYAQLFFFVGLIVVLILNWIVSFVMELPQHCAWIRHAWQQRRARRLQQNAHNRALSRESDVAASPPAASDATIVIALDDKDGDDQEVYGGTNGKAYARVEMTTQHNGVQHNPETPQESGPAILTALRRLRSSRSVPDEEAACLPSSSSASHAPGTAQNGAAQNSAAQNARLYSDGTTAQASTSFSVKKVLQRLRRGSSNGINAELLSAAPADEEEQADAQHISPDAHHDAHHDAHPDEPPLHKQKHANLTDEQRAMQDALVSVDDHAGALQRMGITVAIGLLIHGIPEGITTFVGTLAGGANMGIVLALAVAIHKAPEGLCISMPVYYATGSAWKAFAWTALAAVAEPLGGLLAFLMLSGDQQYQVYGAVFGLVAGIMTTLSFKYAGGGWLSQEYHVAFTPPHTQQGTATHGAQVWRKQP